MHLALSSVLGSVLFHLFYFLLPWQLSSVPNSMQWAPYVLSLSLHCESLNEYSSLTSSVNTQSVCYNKYTAHTSKSYAPCCFGTLCVQLWFQQISSMSTLELQAESPNWSSYIKNCKHSFQDVPPWSRTLQARWGDDISDCTNVWESDTVQLAFQRMHCACFLFSFSILRLVLGARIYFSSWKLLLIVNVQSGRFSPNWKAHLTTEENLCFVHSVIVIVFLCYYGCLAAVFIKYHLYLSVWGHQ